MSKCVEIIPGPRWRKSVHAESRSRVVCVELDGAICSVPRVLVGSAFAKVMDCDVVAWHASERENCSVTEVDIDRREYVDMRDNIMLLVVSKRIDDDAMSKELQLPLVEADRREKS